MYIFEVTITESDYDRYWQYAIKQGKPVSVKSRLNNYQGFAWKGHFFYKEAGVVRAMPLSKIKSNIV